MFAGKVWLLLDSSGLGGIETHVQELGRALKLRRHPVEVVFLKDHGAHPMTARLRENGIPFRFLDGGPGSLLRAVRSEKPALIHTHGYKAGILGRIAGLTADVAVVSTFHAGEPGAGRVRLYNCLDKASARLAHEIVAVSEPIALSLPRRAHLISNFVGLGKAGCSSHGKVAYVGRLSKEKGPDLFCKLSQWLGEEDVILYGDGPMRDRLQSRYPKLHFAGQQTSMAGCWAEIGLLCVTSRNEGLPLAALEAMANGVPVAAFRVGGLPSLIQHGVNGWLIEPGNLIQFARVVDRWRILAEDVRATLSSEARRTIASRYSTDVIVPLIERVYDAAIARGRHLQRSCS